VAIQDFDLSPSDTQVQPDDILVAQATAPAATDATAAAGAAPATVTIEVSEGNILRLPEGASIESPRINGTNLEFVQPDGTVIVVPNGAITGLIIAIGTAEIPAETVAALFDANGIETAAGPEGPTALPSSGGNFATPVPGIGDGLPLIDLLPPTDFSLGTPELEELASGEERRTAAAVNGLPAINLLPGNGGGLAQVDEAGLPAGTSVDKSVALFFGQFQVSDPTAWAICKA
jgi:hypothetical protein